MKRPAPPTHLAVGRIGRAHGIRGEVSVDVLTDFPERFSPGAALYIGSEHDDAPEPSTILSVRPHQDRLLVHFDIAPDRTAAEALTGLFILIPAADAHALDPDSFYIHELIGLAVQTDAGEALGEVAELIETGSADVLVVRGPAGTVLIPMIGDVIQSIDPPAGRIVITPLPGLLPEKGEG